MSVRLGVKPTGSKTIKTQRFCHRLRKWSYTGKMGAKGDLGTSGSKGKSNTFSFSLSASRFLMVFPDVSKFLME